MHFLISAEALGVKGKIPVDGPVILGSVGFCAGSLIKKLGKLIGYTIVALSVATHVIERNGYVTVHWDKIQRDITANPAFAKLDKNHDGKVDSGELQVDFL